MVPATALLATVAHERGLPYIGSEMHLCTCWQTLVLVGVGVVTSATWLVWRHAGWAWVLQDLMGLALVLNIMATLRIPNLKVEYILDIRNHFVRGEGGGERERERIGFLEPVQNVLRSPPCKEHST